MGNLYHFLKKMSRIFFPGEGTDLLRWGGPSQLIKVINKSLKEASFLSLRGAFSGPKIPF
jgi:hypothetical protein